MHTPVLGILVLILLTSCNASMHFVHDILKQAENRFDGQGNAGTNIPGFEFQVPQYVQRIGEMTPGPLHNAASILEPLQQVAQQLGPYGFLSSLSQSIGESNASLQEQHTSCYFYRGDLDMEGRRTGHGIFISNHDGTIYVGGFQGDKHHGSGITFAPTIGPHKEGMYGVGVHVWNNGLIVRVIEDVSRALSPDVASMLNIMGRSGCSIDRLEYLRQFLQIHDSNNQGTAAAYQQFSSHAVIPLTFIPARIGESLSLKNIAYGNTVLPERQYKDSIFIPFTISESRPAHIMLFTTDENYHPVATLWAVDDNLLANSNKLAGFSHGSGFDIPINFDNSKRYYLEVGSRQDSGNHGGAFKVVISDTSYTSQLNHETFSFTNSDYIYSLRIGGDFTQKNKRSGETFRVGTFSNVLAPYYNRNDRSVTYYFTDGDKCGHTPRSGKLIITDRDDDDKLELTNVVESPTCVYNAYGKSRLTWKYKTALQQQN